MIINLGYKKDHDLEVAKTMVEIIIKKPEALFCIAGGDSPLGILDHFKQLIVENNIDISKVHFISLDEWVGIDSSDTGSCRYYLDTHLFNPLSIDKDHIHFFTNTLDYLQQIMDMDTFLDTQDIDFLLLGVGVNSHLGFNEPDVSLENKTHISDLDETTQSVGKKYFSSHSTPRQGITLGLSHLLKAKEIVVVANTKTKKEAISSLLDIEYNPTYPITALFNASNCISYFSNV